MTLLDGALLAGAAIGAGIVNAVAGGGTLLTFPALLSIGLSPVAANATNTLALWPGQLSSAFAYGRHLKDQRRLAISLAVPSVLGGLVGSQLVLRLSERSFELVVPWLILVACALLAAQTLIKKALSGVRGIDHPAILWLVQLGVGIYGGYFGAAMGIMMMAALGVLLPSSQQHANALKVLFSFLINGAAAFCFLGSGKVALVAAAVMAVANTLGGFVGARLAQRLPPAGMRGVAVAVGLYAALRLWVR